MIDIPRIDPKGNGVVLGWWLMAKNYVLLRCPNGHTATLHTPSGGHEVDDDGVVTPSVVCPYEAQGCTFHEMVRLLDWSTAT